MLFLHHAIWQKQSVTITFIRSFGIMFICWKIKARTTLLLQSVHSYCNLTVNKPVRILPPSIGQSVYLRTVGKHSWRLRAASKIHNIIYSFTQSFTYDGNNFVAVGYKMVGCLPYPKPCHTIQSLFVAVSCCTAHVHKKPIDSVRGEPIAHKSFVLSGINSYARVTRPKSPEVWTFCCVWQCDTSPGSASTPSGPCYTDTAEILQPRDQRC